MAEYYNTKGERLESWFETYLDNERQSFIDNKATRQLEEIRQLRNQELKDTDYFATSDNVLSDEIKTFRKTMRDIPQDYSETDYDDLLNRDKNNNLTHTVWEKP